MKLTQFLSLSILLAAAPCVRAASLPNAHSSSSATADLTGSGKRNYVQVKSTMNGNQLAAFTLIVDSTRFTEQLERDADMDVCDGVGIVQINNDRPQRQIIVGTTGSDDIMRSYVFGYDGTHIFKIGMVCSSLDVPGNGFAYSRIYMDFWTATEKNVVDVKKRSIDNVPQPSYYVGETATAKAAFPVLQARSAKALPSAVVAPGSKFTVMTFTPDTFGQLGRGEPGWYLIKTQTGLCGWAQVKTFQHIQNGLVWAD